MRKIVLAVIGVLAVVGVLAAQSHDNNVETKTGDEMRVDETLRVGDVTLPPGVYRVVCNREKITMTRTLDSKRFEVPCKGTLLTKKADSTRQWTNVDKSGVRFLEKLLIRGSNVEHIFD